MEYLTAHLIYFCKVVPLANTKSLYRDLRPLVCTLPNICESSATNLYPSLDQFVAQHALGGEKLAYATQFA